MIYRFIIGMTLIIVGFVEFMTLSYMGYLNTHDFITSVLVYTILFEIICGYLLIIPSLKMKGE